MNEEKDLQLIEDLLRGLPLRLPSAALDERVLAARPKSVPAARRRTRAGLLVAGATVAAALLAVVLLSNRGGDQPEQAATPKEAPPAAGDKSVPVEAVARPAVRRVRQQIVREVRPSDRQHNAVIEWRSEQTQTVQYN